MKIDLIQLSTPDIFDEIIRIIQHFLKNTSIITKDRQICLSFSICCVLLQKLDLRDTKVGIEYLLLCISLVLSQPTKCLGEDKQQKRLPKIARQSFI